MRPLRASISARSCGVDTMTAPASGTRCAMVSCASPVPGGMSTIRMSSGAPLHVAHELLQRAHHHRAAPDGRRVGAARGIRSTCTSRRTFRSARSSCRPPISGARRCRAAKAATGRRCRRRVCRRGAPGLRERERDVDGGRRFSDAALARRDGDDGAHLGQQRGAATWRRLRLPGRRRSLRCQHGRDRSDPGQPATACSAALRSGSDARPRSGFDFDHELHIAVADRHARHHPAVTMSLPALGIHDVGERRQHVTVRNVGHGRFAPPAKVSYKAPANNAKARQHAGEAARRRRRSLGRRRRRWPWSMGSWSWRAARTRFRRHSPQGPGAVPALLPGGVGGSRGILLLVLAAIALVDRLGLVLPRAAGRAGRGAAVRRMGTHHRHRAARQVAAADRDRIHSAGHAHQPHRDRACAPGASSARGTRCAMCPRKA